VIGDSPEVDGMRRDVDEMSGMLRTISPSRAATPASTRSRPTGGGAGGIAQRRRAQRPRRHRGVPWTAGRDGEAGGVQALPRQLVSNAARHANTISITGHRDHRYLTVTVDDDGPGIPAGMREEVFKPSCGWTTPATRMKAARAWAWPSPATSRARMAATSRSRQPDGRPAPHGADPGVGGQGERK